MGYFYMDPTYILVIIGALLCGLSSYMVKSTYKKYSVVRNRNGYTGAMAAQMILQAQGITDVEIRHISGELTDNYNPVEKTLNLSDTTYDSTSVAAVGVAAHECGHAIQHHKGYVPIAVRNSILPFANLGQSLSWILIIVGLIFYRYPVSALFFRVGILAFGAVVLFQLVTLPVEINASSRALKILKNSGMLDSSELSKTRKVLSAAAMTYVAAAASSLLQLLRLILLSNRRR